MPHLKNSMRCTHIRCTPVFITIKSPLGRDLSSSGVSNGRSIIWSNGEVISYNLSRHPNLNQVTDMLEKAFTKIPDNTNLILHSDQGWQYQHKHYQKMLKEKGIRQSISRKGNCLDNACAENFFGLLKTELLYLQEFHSVEHFIQELHEYIEWYNNKRIKLKLNGLSPIDFRQEAA